MHMFIYHSMRCVLLSQLILMAVNGTTVGPDSSAFLVLKGPEYIGYSKENLKIQTGVPSPPLLPLPCLPLPLPLPLPSYIPFP